jgi:hypothetical protein
MNSIITTPDRAREPAGTLVIVLGRASAPVNVEVGTGAIAPKVAIARGKTSPYR